MPGTSQRLMSTFSSMAALYHPSHHRQRELTDAIVKQLVVAGNLPLSLVEQQWFREFMGVVDPKFKVPSRYKINSLVSQKFKEKRAVLESKLLLAKHVTITLDMWSDRRMRSYMGITVHFMTSDMQFNSYLLDFNYFVGKHTGNKLLEHTTSVIDKFNLKEKLCYVITDNAANMLSAFKDLSGMIQTSEDVTESDHENDEIDEHAEETVDERETSALNSVAGDDNEEHDLVEGIDDMMECEAESVDQVLDYIGGISEFHLLFSSGRVASGGELGLV
jgi:hypothetical protein